MVSWQYWHYCDCDDPTTAGPGIQSLVIDPRKPPKGDNLKREKLAIFSRPYPRAVAGTPTAYDFNPESREFNLGYRSARSAAASSARRPDRGLRPPGPLPRRLRGRRRGREGRLKPGKRVLRLRNAPGEEAVSVRVTPG